MLSEDLGVDKSAVVATVMKQILEGIAVSTYIIAPAS